MFNLKNLFGGKKTEDGAAQPQSDGKGGVVGAVSKLFDKNEKEVARLRPAVDRIRELGDELKKLSDEELKQRSADLRLRFREDVTARLQKNKNPETGDPYEWLELDTEFTWTDDYVRFRREAEKAVLDELLYEAFALVREAGDRTIGLRHFDVQMIGGAVLHSGRISEMKTGEGKTLVATLPVYLNTLSGRGVHVITVNDYLAERDANWMRPIYEFLGLTVSFLANDMETEARQAAYAADVMYATNSEVGFDYLRDNMARSAEDCVQRPLNFAIVDEVDNILIDEARTPLIISAQVAKTDRALRRQDMAKTCDKVGRKLMPGVTDREVENLIDTMTNRGRVNIDELMQEIIKRRAFIEAVQYLIDSYLIAEKTARTENAARLLDVADEFKEHGLIEEPGRHHLEVVAAKAVQPAQVRAAWIAELERMTAPFARAWSRVVAANHDPETTPGILATELALAAEASANLPSELAESVNPHQTAAEIVAEEMVRRGLIDPDSVGAIAASLLDVEAGEAAAEAPRKNETTDAVESRRRERVAALTYESLHPALVGAALNAPGNLQDVDVLLAEALPELGNETGEATQDPAAIRRIVNTLEQIAEQGMLPFDALEHLWEKVQLRQGREALRREIAGAIHQSPGATASKISGLVEKYGADRTAFLSQAAANLRGQLSAHPVIAQRAETGENITQLRRLLENEVTKTGAYAEAMKAARAFVSDQGKAHHDIVEHLTEEMAQWVEVPREARRALISLFDESGRPDQVKERVLLAIRDLPGENTELPALVEHAVQQLKNWRNENGVALTDKVTALVELPATAVQAIQVAVEDGEFSSGFEHFVGEQLLTSPEIAPMAEAIDAFGSEWDAFKRKQNDRLLTDIEASLPISTDAFDALVDLLGKPIAGALDAAIFSELASDATSHHLEPLLTKENAEAFAEEVKRRIPLAKELQKEIKPDSFAGRSAEQLERALVRMVEHSLQVMPFEDYKRVIKNLAWMTEKDERRRTAALTDIGTLIAEREATAPIFAEPENFLDTLLSTDILTEEEVALIMRAQAEAPNETVAATVDRVLRLPAERRRRLSETKLQEVQPILDQSIKAHALFQREVNYVIEGGKEIVIVDEFTGHKMPGRRYSEGLHEALEAKHGLEVQLESQTVATITIQNYFRLYDKLAGMTGTAKTEEAEFAKTYGIEVVTIPTNRNVRRADAADVVYKTAEAKMRAITFEVLECHCAGQPVLVGTRSVDVSERMSDRLKPQPLQALVLAHLIKTRLWDDKEKKFDEPQRQEILAGLRAPVTQLNLMQLKNLAKTVGLPPDALHEENISRLMGLFTVPNADRNRLSTALRVGLAHNVLNAKNHRNEARIVAEAARPASVTIATNMAGRGVDIVLGGTLDVESRRRVITLQTLARQIEGKPVHVRARNQEATDKYVERLTPKLLQDLAWVNAVTEKVTALESSGAVEGQVAKEIRDALGQDLMTPDLKNRVRSRARRLDLAEKLPLDADPLQDNATLQSLANALKRLMDRTYTTESLRGMLESGIEARATGRDIGETAVLQTLSVPLRFAFKANAKLLETLATVPDMDRQLLEAAAAANAVRFADFDLDSLAEAVPSANTEWVADRLKSLSVHDSPSAQHKLDHLHAGEVEVNEAQMAAALGEEFMGVQWLRERVRGWNLVKSERAYSATPAIQELLGDTAVVHYRLQQENARQLWDAVQSDPQQHRELTTIEAPNLVLLSDMANIVGHNSELLDADWLHEQMLTLRLVDEADVFQAQMTGTAEDEQGVAHEVPIDVLVYRIRLPRLLEALAPTLREAVAAVGNKPSAVHDYLASSAPWLADFIDVEWVAQQLGSLGAMPATPEAANVFIETGVAGQSADIVLESEPRPEDIAHTSEQEEVKALGGLHIVGTERHESRRIDNQLRGRAGRQGDPGSSRFFVSLEDELWRLFGVRGQALLNKWDEDDAVESVWISKSIERAQKKVELNHFESRKHVLQYDDVMNLQRETIYRERKRALLGDDLRDTVLDMAQNATLAEAEKHCPAGLRVEEWDTHKLYVGLGRLFGASLVARQMQASELDDFNSREDIDERLKELVETFYAERETQVGEETMRAVERWQVMRSIDEHWMEHLAEMDYLRDAIWQEGYAQKEPIGVYRQEGYALFQKMLGEIRREVTEAIFSMQLGPQRAQPVQSTYSGPQIVGIQETRVTQTLPMDHGVDDGVELEKDDLGDGDVVVRTRPSAPITQTLTAGTVTAAPATRTVGAQQKAASGAPRAGRNDPCPCGSGKKYKKCCLPKEQGTAV